jgi:hypothetical protein
MRFLEHFVTAKNPMGLAAADVLGYATAEQRIGV